MELTQEQKRKIILDYVTYLSERLVLAQNDLRTFDGLPENNQFTDFQVACKTIEGKLYVEALDDCEGSYNCGLPLYEQKFIVNGELYLGELKVKYGRYDKMYYFIDDREFQVTPIK